MSMNVLEAGLPPTAEARGRRTSAQSGIRAGRWWTPYLFIVPALGLFGLTFAWPAVVAIQLAFYNYNVISPPVFVGLDNFVEMFGDPTFYQALRNSGIFLILYVPLTVVVPLLLAMLVNLKLPGIKVYRAIYYLPVITSMVAVAVAWQYLLSDRGVINWALSLVGIPSVSYLLSTTWALPAVVLIESWKSSGLYMLIYLAGLQAVPTELIEAAKVDGANLLHRIRHVIVPGLRPVFAVTLTLTMLDAMRAFESVFILTRGGPQGSTTTLGYYIYEKAFQQHDLGYASAVGLVLWAIMVVLALLNLAATRSRE